MIFTGKEKSFEVENRERVRCFADFIS